jgi:hypothetical protein
VLKLRPAVARVHAATRVVNGIHATLKRNGHAATPEKSPKQTKRELRDQEQKRKRLEQANVEADPRTAMGQRELDIIGLGSSLRASINHFNSCLRNRLDRTNSRILAWAKFDELQDWVHRGDLKSPGLEPSIDSSSTPDVANAKLEAKRIDADLRRTLGTYMHALMVQVIFWQRPYTELPLYGSPKEVGIIFKRALDLTAGWYGIQPDDERGYTASRAIERRNQERRSSL